MIGARDPYDYLLDHTVYRHGSEFIQLYSGHIGKLLQYPIYYDPDTGQMSDTRQPFKVVVDLTYELFDWNDKPIEGRNRIVKQIVVGSDESWGFNVYIEPFINPANSSKVRCWICAVPVVRVDDNENLILDYLSISTQYFLDDIIHSVKTIRTTITIDSYDYILESTIDKATDASQLQLSADFTVKPNCICYVNSEENKKVQFEFTVDNIQVRSDKGLIALKDGRLLLSKFVKWYVRMYDDDTNKLITEKEITEKPFFDYEFQLPENTMKKYTFECIARLFGKEYNIGKEQIVVERQKYCHSISIEARTYDKEGNETNKFPHPTSSDYDENKHSEIIIKIKIKDEQGNYIDVPVANIHTNWQYSVTKIDTGQYELRIPNTANNALNIQDYGISVYIDKQWCNENGYYNKYNIEAENIIINNDKIEKIGLWNFEGITGYENGTTLLNQVYEKVSGIFVNPIVEFSIVEQLNEGRERKQYSYCYRIYDSPITLNLPTYTDEEKKELAKAIVREMGKPRKVETFTLLTKEIPKINSVITVGCNGKLISIPVYSVRFSLENSNIQIQIRNDQLKLLKDYLSLIK